MVTPRADVVDLSYGRAAVGFLAWARAAGADRLFDGLGMLVEQAADSFRIWHGKRPYTDEAYEELRTEFGSPLASDRHRVSPSPACGRGPSAGPLLPQAHI